MADKYMLKVTAGPDYTEQHPIAINSEEQTRITSPHLTANLNVRIQNFRGLDANGKASALKTSPYFSQPPHGHDLYSVQFSFTPKEEINGHDLVFGNDFDHPIRDKLPPGFQQAFNIVKWFIDPGLYGDVQADEPYLYGPLLSSMNVWRVGPKDDKAQEKLEEVRANASSSEPPAILQEGGDGDGEANRSQHKIPADAAARKKFFLTEQHLKDFTFESGREYSNDFFNPYLDFNEFALRLPGFSVIPGITIPIISYWDGQPLRYVMKNRKTDQPLLVLVFTLVPKEEVENGGQGAGEEKSTAGGQGEDDLD
ncbi:hypothetical protein LTR62_003276 [Meristemomyces frigidus]|uniref:Domain of unknown function at the cortex 1 domain-containing protein n=1 Tax=Meristemomyces frigidus TaxID=1508187 RepID=A0AAN7TJX2_9PEZI|nr:hypothetical protein LTR62_003276 [Meristemomyces frigidus]